MTKLMTMPLGLLSVITQADKADDALLIAAGEAT
jgi:hypothetical protein